MKKFILSLILSFFILLSEAQGPTEIWGVTKRGGTGFGALFKMDNNGNNPFLVHSFDGKVSAKYSSIEFHEAGNDKLYAAMNGGIYDEGVIIELDPATGVVIEKAHFNSMVNGRNPRTMTLGPNGKFYGIFEMNTTDKQEAIFEYDIITNTIIKKADFKSATGKSVYSTMLLAKNGKLYGTTDFGGIANEGILYEYDPITDSIIKKVDFSNSTVGAYPGVRIMELDNKLYGCTETGGTKGGGTIYEYNIITNTCMTKFKLDAMMNSRQGVILGNDGLFYGAMNSGPTNTIPGSFFKFDPASLTLTVIQNFSNSTTGVNPFGVKKCKNGLLYGILSDGGMYGAGSIYEYDPVTAKFKIVFNFKDSLAGVDPYSFFEQAKNGKLYAGTYGGGKYGRGVLFEFDITYHTYKKIQDLGEGLNGDTPSGTLSLADNGKIYTVTNRGGKYNNGVLLECDPSTQPGVFTKKIDFNGLSGTRPTSSPVQGPNGKLYGTTSSGGKPQSNSGVLYQYDPVTNSIQTKLNFLDSTVTSAFPGGIVLASNNKFYGIATFGKHQKGVLFEFDPATGKYAERADLIGEPGSYITGELMQAKNGKLYGLLRCGLPAVGVLFEYTLTSDTIAVKVRLNNAFTRDLGTGRMVEAHNGKLYGIITTDLEPDYLFEYDPTTEVFQNVFSFNDASNGLLPVGDLLMASNGNLYGMTNNGGSDNRGVVYEYNYTTHVYTKKFDLKGPFGMNPGNNNNLIEVCKSIPYQGNPSTISICETKNLALLTGLDKKDFTFQWYKDQHPISSATSEKLIVNNIAPGDSGIYFCKVSNGCRSIQTAETTVRVLLSSDPDCGVGINEQEKITFEIYPNPVKDKFQIRVDQTGSHLMTVELRDVLGKLVLQETVILSGQTATINMAHLENGIYGIRIRDATNTIFENRKLIKQ